MASPEHPQIHSRSSGDLLADRRYAWAEGLLAGGDLPGAVDLAGQVIEVAPGYGPAWFLLGEALAHPRSELPDSLDRARAAFEMVLRLDPSDSLGARMRLSQLGMGDGETALTPAYVRSLFDGYAHCFDRHLVEGLGYHGPALIRDAVVEAAGRACLTLPFRRVLDLGCGTGLMAVGLRDVALSIVGVDLSPGMLAKARALSLYEALHEGDLVDFLDGYAGVAPDLVVAADVFAYVRDLVPALAAASRALAPGGQIAFTLQSWEGSGAMLGKDGRYAHGRDAIVDGAAACGLTVAVIEAVSARRQGGQNVPGWLVVLVAPDAAGQPSLPA